MEKRSAVGRGRSVAAGERGAGECQAHYHQVGRPTWLCGGAGVVRDCNGRCHCRAGHGKSVRPREWFLMPLSVIDEIVARIGDGTLVDYTYDRERAALVLLA